ncbi:hypothetical protein H5410_056208 [Solanum commersonii]|uniref:Uncharacterized protein n=1 Tax=Solanum commersonii TaxID=4109 RepID=A0A9J5WKM0_SOLCO|nr:hypothetical protein H5410_056208 [Solanum commersonii]
MDNEIQKLKTNEDNLKSKASQQHDYKNAELRTSKQVSDKQHKNANLNQLFEKPFTQMTPRHMSIEPQTSTYADSLQNQKEKKTYNYITRTYIENIYKIQTFLNLNLRSTTTQEPSHDYLTQRLQVYTYDGEELSGIPELHKAFITYKRVTKGNLFYVKFYTAIVEILYEEIKPPIQVMKIGLIKDMIIPEDIGQQPEIQKNEIPNFYANKRIIDISTIIQELANNYLNGNAIWSYYARDQLMIYSNSGELRKEDMDEPEERPTTRALKVGFILAELLTRYCKLIGHKYPDHICSKCNGEDNIIPDVQLE